MKITIESNADYQISPENYKVKIKKDGSEIMNQEVLSAINQAMYQAVEQVYGVKL